MAATLVDGKEYGLSSDVSSSGKKTVIHFKLTDSALRALEEYSKIKATCIQSPSVQFTNSKGVMSIPGTVGERSFQVTLASIHGDANGSFDCVQQLQTRLSSGLQCLGSMQFKVTTHANNDVYTDTRKKIAIADTESKKACAKEIKMASRIRGKAVKKVISGSQFRSLHGFKPLTHSTTHRPSSSITSRVTPPSMRSVSLHQGLGEKRTSGQSVVSSNGIVKLEGQTRSRQTSEIISMPYKDRVIHLLAVRSYKKPELIARLMKDGIKEKDRESLGAILKLVSVLNKDNSHSLARQAWAFVRPDWPYYNEMDRLLLKKNQEHIQALESASSSPTVNPADCHSPEEIRRTEEALEFPSKKQRIAHNQKSLAPSSRICPPSTTTHTTANTTNQHSGQNTGRQYRMAMSLTAKAVSDSTTSVQSSNTANKMTGGNSNASPPEYISQYVEITNCQQRRRYKDDFNRLYEEYQHVLARVKRVSQKFQNLRDTIFSTPEGSQEFEVLYDKVMEEYERHKDDKQFCTDKHRLDFLHGLLGHIKRLIITFDRTHRYAECR